MKKALIFTDPHLRPSYIEIGKRVLNLVKEKLRETGADHLFILGDVFHTKNLVYASVQNLYQKFLEDVAKEFPGITIIQIVGNHDWGVQYSEHPFKGLKHIPGLTIVEDYYVYDKKNLFLAYAREKERFQEFLQLGGPDIERVFSHMDMDGFTPGSGWEEISPFMGAEEFSNYKQIISGHLHLAQEKILKNGTEIIFVGSPYTTDFGESDQTKRFLLLDLESGKWESVPTDMTMHKTYRINSGEPLPEIPEEEVKRGIEHRVIIKGTREEIAALIIPKGYMAKIAYEFTTGIGARIELSAADNQDDTIRKYIKEEIKRSFGGEDKAGFDLEKLLKVGKRFIPNG